jgi:hypothetical protein
MLTKAQIHWDSIGTAFLLWFVFYGLWKGGFLKSKESVLTKKAMLALGMIFGGVIVVAIVMTISGNA